VGGWRGVERLLTGRERWAHDERVLGSGEFVRKLLEDEAPPVVSREPEKVVRSLVTFACAHFRVTPGEIASRSLRPCVLDARAAVSYAAVTHHGLSYSDVARWLGLSRRSISRGILRAQISDLTELLPRAEASDRTVAS
jgi:hypothetical protein